MAYVPVPKDLNRVKTKVALNLTKRQMICFSAALGVGLPVFFSLRLVVNTDLATLGLIAACVPFFLAAMYEKDGMPFEIIAWNYVQVRFLRPKARPYRTENYYALLMRIIELNTEVKAIVRPSLPAGKNAGSQPAKPQSGTAKAD